MRYSVTSRAITRMIFLIIVVVAISFVASENITLENVTFEDENGLYGEIEYVQSEDLFNISYESEYIDIDELLNESLNEPLPNNTLKLGLSSEVENLKNTFSEYEFAEQGTKIIVAHDESKAVFNGLEPEEITDIKMIHDAEMAADIFAINSVEVEQAVISLRKNRDIDNIMYCDDFDFETGECTWLFTNLEFEQNGTHVWFTATHFSAYTGWSNDTNTSNSTYAAAMLIWDSTDNDLPYANKTIYPTNTTEFFANYSVNETRAGADCRITFDSLQAAMQYNMEYSIYYYNRTFDSPGTYAYTVNCYNGSYDNLTAADNVIISSYSSPQSNTTNSSDTDYDGDGYNASIDCDDLNPNVNPGMQEIPYNMIDDDCNISTPDYLVLELVASKQTYSLGEISYITIDAHYGSDVYITVNTPINISYIYIFSNKSYPITQEFVFTNRSGTYSVESILYYTNYTLTKTLDFNVENSIQAQISVNQSVIYVNDRVTLSASASGGLGSLTYEWNLDDGTTSTQQTLGHTYTQPGTYNIVLIVKDLENNQVVVTKQLIVLRKYSVKITVVDNCTNHTLDDARVKLDDEKKYTENGAVEFIATNKTYSLRISKSEYEDYEDTITIDSDTYFTIGLKSENDLDVILLAPINNSEITSNAQFKFTATAYANCTLYTSEDNSWWTSQKSIAAAPGEEIGIGANDLSSALEKGVYYWKIECENIDSVFSETWRFKLTDIIVDSDNEEGDENPKIFTSAGEEMEENETFNVVQEVYNLLPDFDKFTPEQKRVAEILVLESKLKESKKKLDMANRDLFNLRYKTDSADIIETRDEILVRIETIKDETPISVRVEKNVQFIKYIEDDDAEELLKRYSDIKHLEASRSYIEQNKMLQKKITISTEAYNVELEYLSKRVEKFTIVSKSIELGSETNTLRLVEFLPKDIVQSADDIILLTGEALVIEKDPILELDLNTGVRELSYKLSNQINLDIIPKIKSLVVALDVDESQNRITGLAVLDKIGVSSKNKFIFVIEIVVIVVLLVVYMKNTKKLSNEDFEQVPSTFAEMQKILSDAEVLLTQNKVEEAAMKYEESKLMFNALEDRQKEQLYPEITELCNKTNYHYLLKLIEDIYSHLATKDHERVIELYNELNQEYQQLPENYKETIYPKCLELASILGDNEK